MPIWRSAVFLMLIMALGTAQAATYANVSVPFNWIDASTHTKLGPTTGGVYSPTYRFLGRAQTSGSYRCGTYLPSIDDAISDNIPLGFSFMYGGVNFTQVRIMSNGRLQFNDNLTCYYGSPVTQLPYPNANLNYTMRVYGGNLDPSLQSEISGYSTPCTDRNTCYVSYATLGTAPYRKFVVTWNNVPEWTTSSSATGNYNLQVILQENGEFIYQYGTNTPGPGNATGQVGWQVDSNDYDVPAVGYPAANSAIKFYIPQPVAEYRMEQPSWSGTAGEVYDTSGNGRHGVRVGSAQTIAGGKVCRGASIPSNNNTSIDAINTGIGIPGTVGGQGTITFWFKPNAWTGSGVQSNQLFDATVVDNGWFFLTKRRIDNTNVRLHFQVRDSTGVSRSVETPDLKSSDLAGGWVHVAVTWNFNALAGSNQDRLRIYVNGVLRGTSAFTSAGSLSANIGTLYVGDNRSTYIQTNGTARSANGVIDEFRIYNFEGALALVQRDMNQTGDCLDHYAISHAGTARACDENNVTVTAHTAAHGLVVMPNNTTQITLSTSTGEGDWSLVNGYGVLNNGTANDGIATYLWNGEYQAVFGLKHTTPGSVNINVTDGQIAEQEDPDLTLTSCVTVAGFNACHDHTASQCKAAGRLYTRLAGAAFDTDVVALDSAGNPDSSFAGKAVISLIARAIPGSVGSDNCFVPDWTSILDNAASAFSAGKLTVSGSAPQAWREVRLKVVCDSTNCPPAGVTACSADNFAIRPPSFTVTSSDANADSTGTSATNTPAIKAGAVFGLMATAVAGYNGTPQIDILQIAAHVGATAPGSVSGSFGAANPATGVATGAAFAYDEVGYFRLNATGVHDDTFTAVDQPGDCTDDFSNTLTGGKFGCKFGNTAATDYFGRFIPDHFDTEVVQPACGAFTYSGQPFQLKVTAKNQGGGTTANYSGAFAKDVTLSDANGAAGAFSPASVAAGDFTGGEADLSVPPGMRFTFTNKLTAPATLKVRGTDGEASSADGTEGTTPIRSGRLVLSNAHGSELLGLTLPIQTQYWTGSAWATNTPDSCTDISSSLIFVKSPPGLATTPTGGNISAGHGSLSFTAPGQQGSVEVCANIGSDADNPVTGCGNGTSHPWLQGSWDADGLYNDNPSARATFGIYQQRAPVIYRRERY